MNPPQQPAVLRYGYGAIAVVLALGAALALRSFDLEGFLFVIAVAAAVWFGGRGPGIFTVVLSIIVLDYFFLSHDGSFAVLPGHVAYFAVFSVLAVVISMLSESRHRAERSLVDARDELEVKVAERTAELQRINEQLRAEVAVRRRAAEELRRSEAFLEEGQRLSHTGSWGYEAASGRLSWSRELYRLIGVDPATTSPSLELSWERTHPDDRERLQRVFQQALQDGRDYEVECRFLLPDGTVRHVESVAHAVLDDHGKLVELIGTTVDVTERREAEQELRQQAALLRLAHDAVLVREADGRILFWNRGAEETYGWSAAEALGRVSHELLQTSFPLPPQEILAITRAQGMWQGELRHVRRDGTQIVVASRWSVQAGAPGAALAILEINRDVTAHKRAEEALRQAQARLTHVSRVSTLGEVTASFAHEINQPLAAIANNANACIALLRRDLPEIDEVREALGDIVSDSSRASAIIDRVRRLAKRSPAERAPLRLAEVVDDVVALAAADAAARRVEIRVELAPDMPAVHGDRVQLQQVLLNLVVNGMDAMSGVPENARVLRIVGARTTQDGGPAATIRVQDAGVGLEGEDERLFEAFYTTKAHGMGMGLAISRSIMEAHGGRLCAEANAGAPGATFAFTLPAAPAEEDA